MLFVIALMQVDKMSNEVLKQVFQDLYSDIATVNPDSVMDALFANQVLSYDDFCRLRQVPVFRQRCRDMMSLLFISTHPQAFIQLRLALLDEYPRIVDEIDKKLPSLTSQLQQLQLSDSNDGKARIYYHRLWFYTCKFEHIAFTFLLTLHAPADHLALIMCSFELLEDITINQSQFWVILPGN